MCRHLARLGAPTTLHALLYEPRHSLLEQSHAPQRQQARLNGDGFGVGWYAEGRQHPVRYRRAQPMWTDLSFASVAEVVSARCLLAAVRSASPGFPVEESCAAPFTSGRMLFSLNGGITGFRGVEPKLRELAGTAAYEPDAQAPVDSGIVFALALARWRAGAPLGEALASVVADVAPLASAQLNLLATDGDTLAGTTYGHTLFTREDGDGIVLASEPYDGSPGWQEVPPGSLAVADARGLSVTRLPLATG